MQSYAARVGLTDTIALDGDTAVAAQYRLVGVPTHFFVGRDGALRDWRIGGLSKKVMESKVAQIVAAESPSETR